jgi:acyl-coenzyme A thioesterase PaaI-like protein
MEDRNTLVTTVSFHSEFIAPAEKDSLLIIRASPTKVGKSLGFVEGDITVEGNVIINFGGVVKKL